MYIAILALYVAAWVYKIVRMWSWSQEWRDRDANSFRATGLIEIFSMTRATANQGPGFTSRVGSFFLCEVCMFLSRVCVGFPWVPKTRIIGSISSQSSWPNALMKIWTWSPIAAQWLPTAPQRRMGQMQRANVTDHHVYVTKRVSLSFLLNHDGRQSRAAQKWHRMSVQTEVTFKKIWSVSDLETHYSSANLNRSHDMCCSHCGVREGDKNQIRLTRALCLLLCAMSLCFSVFVTCVTAARWVCVAELLGVGCPQMLTLAVCRW